MSRLSVADREGMARSSDRQLQTIQEEAARGVERLIREWGAGEKDGEAFISRFIDLLRDAHTRAVYLGRWRAGDTAPFEADDRRFADLVMRHEEPFLTDFEDALVAGRYQTPEGEPRREAVRARASLYLLRIKGTANEAWALATGGMLWWVLDPTEEHHCDDCPALARMSPYMWNALPTVPAAGQTVCLVRCKCTLRDAQGNTAFR